MTAQEIAQSFESFAIDHKPEGWPAVQQKELSDANSYTLQADGEWLMALLHNGQPLAEKQRENMRRLVACWNYCIELDTGAMEVLTEIGKSAADHFAELGHEVAKLTSQNDELLQALKEIATTYVGGNKMQSIARAAIKKVEGG